MGEWQQRGLSMGIYIRLLLIIWCAELACSLPRSNHCHGPACSPSSIGFIARRDDCWRKLAKAPLSTPCMPQSSRRIDSPPSQRNAAGWNWGGSGEMSIKKKPSQQHRNSGYNSSKPMSTSSKKTPKNPTSPPSSGGQPTNGFVFLFGKPQIDWTTGQPLSADSWQKKRQKDWLNRPPEAE